MIGTTQETIKTQTGVEYSYTTPSLQLLTESSFTAPTTYTLGNGITITQQGLDFIKPGQPLMYYITAKNPNANTEQIFIQSSLSTTTGLFNSDKVYLLNGTTFSPMDSLKIKINSGATPANTSIEIQLDLPASTTNNGELKLCIVTDNTPTYLNTIDYSTPQSFTERLNTLTELAGNVTFPPNTTSTETVVTQVKWAAVAATKTIYKYVDGTNDNLIGDGEYIESGDAFYYQLELSNQGNLAATAVTIKEVLEDGVAVVTTGAGTGNATKVETSKTVDGEYAVVAENKVTADNDVITILGLTVDAGTMPDTTWTPGKLYVRIYFTAE